MKKICVFFLISLVYMAALAQNGKDSAAVVSTDGDEVFKKMLDYSRPGKYHKVLENLEGTWSYKGQAPDASGVVVKIYYGTFVWKSFADGRYFIADGTSSKIQMPVRDGKMKEVNYEVRYTIGYNNVKGKFEVATITNVMGSNIAFAEGSYDAAANAITFDSEDSPIPGMKLKFRDVFTFPDRDHYAIESYTYENEKYVKINIVKFTREKG